MKGFALSLVGIFSLVYSLQAQVTLRCEVEGCGPILRLFIFDGAAFKEVQRAKLENNSYVFKVEKSDPKFYYIGQVETVTAPVLLGQESNVTIKGSCGNMQNLIIEGSPLNTQYVALKEEMNQARVQIGDLNRQLQRSGGNQEKVNATVQQMKVVDDRRLAMLDSLKKVNPLFARILALNTYLSYQNYGSDYSDEISYFANEYFKYVDFKDEGYNYLPWVFEAFKSYTLTLSSVNLPDELHKKYIEVALWRIPKGSPAHKLALSGVITTLKQRNHPNFIPFAESFVATYKGIDPAAAGSMQNEIDKVGAFIAGGLAPDFSQPDTSGNEVRLSDFRGKIVLVDFWASWCGPCRRENPNVVAMYNKYKDKGFDILGVSLDNNRDRWIDAITKDGLMWNHVSDLKGWSNSVAQAFGVNSIPHTMLVDRNGKIIARGLRGPALEQKLAELMQ